MTIRKSYTSGHFELSIDGKQTTAYLKSLDGGFQKHAVIDERIGPENKAIKHASVWEVDPFSFEFGMSGARWALGKIAALNLFEREEQAVTVREQVERARRADPVAKPRAEIMLMAEPVPHMAALPIRHAEAATLLEDGKARIVGRAQVHRQRHRSFGMGR